MPLIDDLGSRARETPDRPAVVTGTDTLTYGELDDRTNRLARHLMAAGLAPGETVAVATVRSPDVVVAVIAALKAGGAYAVIDPHGPMDETARMLAAAGAALVVTREELRPRVDDGSGRRLVCSDTEARAIAACSPDPLDVPRSGPAAVLFSAGTTGSRRRAVVVGHTRLRAAYTAWAQVWALDPADRHLVTAAPDTPGFTAGWVRALGSGATLVLPDRPVEHGSWSWPAADGITVLATDPATADTLLAARAPHTLRLVAVGGDRITVAGQTRLQDRLAGGARVLNVYGTAEDACCGTWFETSQLAQELPDPERVSLLGRPFPGGGVDLDGGEIGLTPPGGGEIVVTGDLGVLRTDGLLEFRGRRADRVTARGRTVDPYPAEAALGGHPLIREAVVAADGDDLVAYVVPEAGRAPGVATVRAHLSGVVAEPEIPGRVVLLAELPRNAGGKPDRRVLPRWASDVPYGGGKGGAPMTRADWSLALRWLAAALSLPVALALGALWPGSTDLSAVPQPWATLFAGLYLAELAAFVGGVGFLLLGRQAMLRQGRSPGLTTAAHLAIAWLLASWWPQDNLYRLAAKDDWPQQATLVYVFNVTLMIAAAVVAAFATRRPRPVG